MHNMKHSGAARSSRPRGTMTPEQLQARIDRFAMLAGDLVPESTRSARLRHYGHQLVRCSSSAGASYSEARPATTPRDFEYKLHECEKELRESMSWLKYIAHATKHPLSELLDECDELIAIVTASILTVSKNAKNRHPRKRPKPPNRQ